MERTIDFSECEREPLSTLGFIQSSGCLIAFGLDQKVSHVSENAEAYFGYSPEALLHCHLGEFCPSETLREIDTLLPSLQEGQLKQVAWESTPRPCAAWLHVKEHVYILELEGRDCAIETASPEQATALKEFLDDTAHSTSMQGLAQRTAEAVATMAGYDRVMIYQFHEDWSGQVIAEHRGPSAEPFLGLRYPATDIPSQARQLYMLNPLRILCDVNASPVRVLADQQSPTLDMTYAVLRSMSPYHIEYLRNMNVGATLTASLLVNGRLWGMISCHHLTGKAIAAWMRRAALQMAQAVSNRFAELMEQSQERVRAKMRRQLQRLAEEIDSPEKMAGALCFGGCRLNNLFEIDSAAIYTEGACITVGDAPPTEWIAALVEQVIATGQPVFSYSEGQGGLALEPHIEATGALALVVTSDPATVILGFRTEFEQELTWGGDVTQAATKTLGSERLSPRKSFAAYKQIVRGTSLAWTESELEQAHKLVPMLRQILPVEEAAAAAIIHEGVKRLADAVPSPSSLTRPLLDLVSEGMSLLVNRRGDLMTPVFANQALLNRFNLDDSGPEFLLSLGDFFRHINMPEDLLNRMHFGPQEVQVVTGRFANRNYLIQLKQILEVTIGETRSFLAILTFSDITKQARLLETAEAARKRAEHANRIKSTFLANTTHEVRTPMNGILGVAQLLKDSPLNGAQLELVEIIERSGVALLQIVNDILDFSKIEAGKLTLESISFDLHLLLQDAIRLFRPLAAAQVDLRLAIGEDVPTFLIGDPGRLRQVIINLLGNAIKFTQQGQVSLQVKTERISGVYTTLAFEVADTGVGMPPETAARLFTRFEQGDASVSRKFGGTGLGLSISKELITLMGGHIFASSQPGQGTTLQFRLTFLVEQPDALTSREEATSFEDQILRLGVLAEARELQVSGGKTESGSSMRVLLVDDNAVNLKVAQAMLLRNCCEVTVASNGADAVQLAQECRYDLILMDCQMPNMDGFEASALIRKQEAELGRTPIVALTASVLRNEHERCLAAGMDEVMLKPIELHKIRALTQKWRPSPAKA